MNAKDLNPKKKFQEVSAKYSLDQRGYYHLSELTKILEFLINKWEEIEDESINELYAIKIDLDDFIEEELNNLLNATNSNQKERLRIAESRFSGLKYSFLSLYKTYYPNS